MSNSWPEGRSAERVADALALCIIAAVAGIAALTFRDYGLGWDDYTHAEYGGLLLNLYASGFSDQRALSFVNLYAYGGGFDMLSALAAKILPFDLFETRRLMGAVIGVIGLLGAGVILLLLRCGPAAAAPVQGHPDADKAHDRGGLLRHGFLLLLAIGVIDSATRMGFLTFLPFLLRAKGAGVP